LAGACAVVVVIAGAVMRTGAGVAMGAGVSSVVSDEYTSSTANCAYMFFLAGMISNLSLKLDWENNYYNLAIVNQFLLIFSFFPIF
jgi:hypothetical protein